MKKRLATALSVMLGLSLVGCGGVASAPADTPATAEKAGPSNDAIKVDQIAYEVSSGVIDGNRRVVFDYTNSSDYTVVGVKLELVMKEEVESEAIQNSFDYIIEGGITEEEIRNATMVCEDAFAVEPGATSSKSPVEIGAIYINNIEQYELMQPDMMTIQFLRDGMIYEEYYDYRTGSYSLSSDVIDPNQWGDSELSSAVPRPDGALVVDVDDGEKQFSFKVQGMTEDAFKAYVEVCKEAGFTGDASELDTMYNASSSDGRFDLSLNYWQGRGSLNAYLRLVEE